MFKWLTRAGPVTRLERLVVVGGLLVLAAVAPQCAAPLGALLRPVLGISASSSSKPLLDPSPVPASSRSPARAALARSSSALIVALALAGCVGGATFDVHGTVCSKERTEACQVT